MELVARKEGLESQVKGLKGIVDSAYEFASSARQAITQLLEEKAETRDDAINLVTNFNLVNRQFRDLSVEHDHLVYASVTKAAEYERKCQEFIMRNVAKNEEVIKLETEKIQLENVNEAANVTMNNLHLQLDSLVGSHNQACEASRQWKERSEVFSGQLNALSKTHTDLTTWLDDNSDLIALGKRAMEKINNATPQSKSAPTYTAMDDGDDENDDYDEREDDDSSVAVTARSEVPIVPTKPLST